MEEHTRERPILFSAPMIRALLDGRKTQTRRVVKPGRGQKWLSAELLQASPASEFVPNLGCFKHKDGGPLTCIAPPYGVPGDQLWVREAWAVKRAEPCLDHERDYQELLRPTIRYLADGAERRVEGDRSTGKGIYRGLVEKGRPSIHMSRWASRITLRITDVRVERLQDISEADAQAEGASPCANGWWFDRSPQLAGSDARGAYYCLWEQINGPGSWDANPWVWAVSFEPAISRATQPQDEGEGR